MVRRAWPVVLGGDAEGEGILSGYNFSGREELEAGLCKFIPFVSI
jgi:hypothetical protein